MEGNHKNIIAVGIFLIVFIMAFLLGGDILRSLFLSILAAILAEIGLSKYNKEDYHAVTENKISPKPVGKSAKIVNWKAILTGLAVSIILLVILLFTPPPDGVTELSEDASNLFTLLILGTIFLGGAVTGYMSSDKNSLINSVIFATILGLLMALLSPLMAIFIIPGPIGGIIGATVGKILKKP